MHACVQVQLLHFVHVSDDEQAAAEYEVLYQQQLQELAEATQSEEDKVKACADRLQASAGTLCSAPSLIRRHPLGSV